MAYKVNTSVKLTHVLPFTIGRTQPIKKKLPLNFQTHCILIICHAVHVFILGNSHPCEQRYRNVLDAPCQYEIHIVHHHLK